MTRIQALKALIHAAHSTSYQKSHMPKRCPAMRHFLATAILGQETLSKLHTALLLDDKPFRDLEVGARY